ncbi:MAG TPA: hypothetical protein VN030_01735 [Cellvibrio sp.]|nr:hypothetical protein [Cellvibrio sp.]
MKTRISSARLMVNVLLLGFSTALFAQSESESSSSQADKPAAKKSKADEPATKKMVQEATINLQTTVTGNQEQPRVLYILPWQSPAAEDVDFETLNNQEKSVFSHIEREELRRELETVAE